MSFHASDRISPHGACAIGPMVKTWHVKAIPVNAGLVCVFCFLCGGVVKSVLCLGRGGGGFFPLWREIKKTFVTLCVLVGLKAILSRT